MKSLIDIRGNVFYNHEKKPFAELVLISSDIEYGVNALSQIQQERRVFTDKICMPIAAIDTMIEALQELKKEVNNE